jgi:hypothetical protein
MLYNESLAAFAYQCLLMIWTHVFLYEGGNYRDTLRTLIAGSGDSPQFIAAAIAFIDAAEKQDDWS